MKRLTIVFTVWLMAQGAIAQPSAFQVTKRGAGSPVLLLPGFATPGSVWDETIKNLEGKHQYHIISYAGFNGIAPIEMPWYETIKEELLAYILDQHLSDITIIGHSMGGNLAVDIAAALPDKVTKLVLVDAIPCMRALMMPGVPASQIQYDNPYSKQMLAMPVDTFRQTVANMAAYMTFDKAKADTLTNWMLKADRKTYVYGYTDLLKLDLRTVLDQVNAETLILGASYPDKDVVLANFKDQYANLKNKTIEIASDSRHFIMFDQPAWLCEHINAFLTK